MGNRALSSPQISKAKGTLEELKAYADSKKGELSDDQLQKVAGGASNVCAVTSVFVVGDVVLI